ncbi:TPA: hypothetical protein ACSPMB_000152 [Pseudomonas aeruginosa]
MTPTPEFADQVLAKLFGFPQCCVDFYLSASSDERRQARGIGGLRLCPSCASKDLEQIVDDVASRRICPQPFPIAPREEDFRTIIEDQRFTEAERAWLLANKKRVVPDVDPFDATLLALHEALAELEERTAANIAEEPGRKNLFLAQQELAKNDLLGVVLNRIHAGMKQRVIEQIRGGHIKI